MSDHSEIIAAELAYHDAPAKAIVRAAKGGGIIFFGRLFEYASRFVFGIIIANSIGAEGYGLYSLGVTIVIALAAVAMMGMRMGMVRFLPIALRERDEARVWGTLQIGLALPGLVGLGLAVMLFGLAEFVAESVFHDPAAVPILRWISICIPLVAVGRVLIGATQGFKQMKYQAYFDSILFNIVKIGLSVLFLGLGMGVPGVLAAYTIAWLIEDALLLTVLNRLFPLKRPLRTAQYNVRELVSFSAPICLNDVVKRLGGNLEVLLLGMLGTMTHVGIYSAAVRVQAIGVMFLMAAQTVSNPIISDLYHRGKSVELGRLYQTLTRWSLSFVLPFFITVLLFARPILAIFGKDFEAGAPVLIIVSVGTLVNAGTGICGAMVMMTGHSRLTFLNTAVVLSLSAVLSVILIPMWGIVGAAVSAASATIIVNVARLAEVFWLLKLWPYDRTFVKPFIASAITLVVGLVTSRFLWAELNLFFLALNVAVLWLIYIGVTLLLGLSTEDRLILSRTKRRFSAILVRH